jgi:2-polyprenyl-6-methoxyphenol hydroxylase-like FAD-dependent oxidoreductase
VPDSYDAIVVGARCAGAPTAMLLARRGLRVLVVDRATFPSDTISGHMIKPPAVARLKRWGLLDALTATGCPPIRGRHVQFGNRMAALPPSPAPAPPAYAPRRFVLDDLLLRSARAAGAEVLEGVTLTALQRCRGRVCGVEARDATGRRLCAAARIVIGADGRSSLVARLAGAPTYRDLGPVSIAYLAYWRGLPADGVDLYFAPRRAVGLFPTNDGQTLAFVQAPLDERPRFKGDVPGGYLGALRATRRLADRLACARIQGRILGMAQLPNFFRVPSGPGWALVGDAGHHKDPLVARGISDAWRDSELLADALTDGWHAEPALYAALDEYRRVRDEWSWTVSELNVRLARLHQPLPDMESTWAALTAAERLSDEADAARVSARAETNGLALPDRGAAAS